MQYLITLGFANQKVAERTMDQYANTRTSDAQLIIVDNHYPVNVPEGFWKRIAQELGGVYFDPGRNLGLHEGLNYALREVQATRDDVALIMDPDTKPYTPGWDTGLLKALEIPTVGWASLYNNHSDMEMRKRGFVQSHENGLALWTTCEAVVNSVCGFKLDWVLDCGGFQEPSPFYGGLESMMFDFMKQTRYRWVFLRDFFEDAFPQDLIDPVYIEYKCAHGHLGYPHDFATFVKEKGL